MRNLHKYEELFPDEFEAELKRSPIVYCACGPMEYHCAHGALGMDPVKGYEMCLRAAAISGGIVYPMVPFAPSVAVGPEGFIMDKPANRDDIRSSAKIGYPSIYTSMEVCEKLFYELFESFAEDIGFKVCVFMGSHGPAGELAKKIALKNPVFKGMKIIMASSLSHNQDLVEAEYKRLGIPRISHGGMWESAMFMACNPEFVNPEKLKKAVPGAYEKFMFKTYGVETVPTYAEIKKVSLEFGERLVQTAAERIAADALKALKEKGRPLKGNNAMPVIGKKTLEEHQAYVEQMARISFFFARQLKDKTPDKSVGELLRDHTPLFYHALNYLDYETKWVNPDCQRMMKLADELARAPTAEFEELMWAEIRDLAMERAERYYPESVGVRIPPDYNAGSLKYDPPRPGLPPNYCNYHIANAVFPKSIFDDPEYLPKCFRELMDKSAKQYGCDTLHTSTWLDDNPRWLRLFPKEWIDNLSPSSSDVYWHFGYWGQLLTARGTFNEKAGRYVREHGELRYKCRGSHCSFVEMRKHLDALSPLQKREEK